MATITRTYDIDIADLEYLSHGDTPLLARLFKPRGSGPFPTMVELHGGAWVRGNRLNGNAANEALAKNGVIVAALDFRVPPEARYLVYGLMLLLLMRFRPQGLIPRAPAGHPPSAEEEEEMRRRQTPLYVLGENP